MTFESSSLMQQKEYIQKMEQFLIQYLSAKTRDSYVEKSAAGLWETYLAGVRLYNIPDSVLPEFLKQNMTLIQLKDAFSRELNDDNALRLSISNQMSSLRNFIYSGGTKITGLKAGNPEDRESKFPIDSKHRLTPDQPEHPENNSAKETLKMTDTSKYQIFIVHGRDEAARESVARFVEKLGLRAVILHEQSASGRTIIEKFEDCSSGVNFVIALWTPDDEGRLKGESPDADKGWENRARQNVIFETGYLMGKLGRKNIAILLKKGCARPSDLDGLNYIEMDNGDGWKMYLAREMKSAGLPCDLNLLC